MALGADLLDCFRGHFNPVATCTLGAVERCVGAGEGLIDSRIRRIDGGNADADCDAKLAVTYGNRCLGNFFAQALGKSGGRVQIGAGEQYGEFLAANPAGRILSPQLIAQYPGKNTECRITGRMPVRVVDALEVVDAEYQYGGCLLRVTMESG